MMCAGYFMDSRDELSALLSRLITINSSVGCGDSITLEETGVFEFLRKENYAFLDEFDPTLSKVEKQKLYLKNFTVDTFITGSNTITLDGKIFNIDGNGSRVAPMLYGPKQVIIVVGINKLTDDVDSAIKRTRQIVAPMDAK